MADTDKHDWTTRELAEAANVDASYLRRLLIDGQLAGYKRGRDWLIPYAAGQRFLEAEHHKRGRPPGGSEAAKN
jgi:excisionase family DNA binding protein